MRLSARPQLHNIKRRKGTQNAYLKKVRLEDKSPDIDKRLRQAYETSHYLVDKPSLSIRIGELHPELDGHLSKTEFTHWSYLTAWNPGSRRLSQEENAARQDALLQIVGALDLPYAEGRSTHPTNDWPDEESVLIIGIELAQARALARDFGQLAFVTGSIGEAARLEWVK